MKVYVFYGSFWVFGILMICIQGVVHIGLDYLAFYCSGTFEMIGSCGRLAMEQVCESIESVGLLNTSDPKYFWGSGEQ